MSKSRIALLSGGVPTCDRCAEEDALVRVDLPERRCLCENCVVLLINYGLKARKPDTDDDVDYLPFEDIA